MRDGLVVLQTDDVDVEPRVQVTARGRAVVTDHGDEPEADATGQGAGA